MEEKVNLETLAQEFDKFFGSSSISRGDWLFIDGETIYIVEETNLYALDLAEQEKFEKFLVETVKKMWGSLAVLLWWSREKMENLKGKKRVFLLKLGVDETSARFIPLLIKKLHAFKDGAYEEIQYEQG